MSINAREWKEKWEQEMKCIYLKLLPIANLLFLTRMMQWSQLHARMGPRGLARGPGYFGRLCAAKLSSRQRSNDVFLSKTLTASHNEWLDQLLDVTYRFCWIKMLTFLITISGNRTFLTVKKITTIGRRGRMLTSNWTRRTHFGVTFGAKKIYVTLDDPDVLCKKSLQWLAMLNWDFVDKCNGKIWVS